MFKRKLKDSGPDIIGDEIIHRLCKQWDDKEGQYIYFLYAGMKNIWDDGIDRGLSKFWRLHENHDDEGWIAEASGDKPWADRIARHYKIKIQEKK